METLENINISANIPEGTKLVENSISDNGTIAVTKYLGR